MQVTGTQDTRELTAQPEPPRYTEGGGITAQPEVLELVWGDTGQLFSDLFQINPKIHLYGNITRQK